VEEAVASFESEWIVSVQTTYPSVMPVGYPGMIADSGWPHDIRSCIAAAAVNAGIFVLTGTTEQACRPPAATDAAAASATAILATAGASTAGIQTLTGAALNGAVGVGTMFPPRNVTLTFSNHADWDATTAVVTGKDQNGDTVTENLAIPNNGNATVIGAVLFSSITSIVIPAQSGTGGTFTAGTGLLLGNVEQRIIGVTLYDALKLPGGYVATQTVGVMRKGRIWVASEDATSPESPAYVRFQVTGVQVYGAVRATPDGTSCVRLRGARFVSKTSGAGLSVLSLNLPSV
jgi:hypothetical protein